MEEIQAKITFVKSGNYSTTTEGYFQIVRILNDIVYDKKYRNFYLLTFGICIPKIFTQYKFLNNFKIVSNHERDAIFTNKLYFLYYFYTFLTAHIFLKKENIQNYKFLIL